MPAPFHGFKQQESLAAHIMDLANQFSSVAAVLSQQYTDLNKATNGLLDGTFPWKGMAATKFLETWQNFGKYMLQLQKSCEDTHVSLVKLSNTISDIEGQQAWNFLLMVVGGIISIVSFAAAIAELGLNPFVDGFFAAISTFTEQEGSEVTNVAEEITQADTQAATELQQIEEELTTSPTLTGTMSSTVGGDIAGGIPEADLNELTLGAYRDITKMTSKGWDQWIDQYTFDYNAPGSLDGISGPNTCVPSAAQMAMEDNGITNFSEQEIMNNVQYDPATGTQPGNLAKGLRQMGLPSATYNPNMTLTELENEASPGKSVITGINLGTDPNSRNEGHAVLVDGFQDTHFGRMVLIRDPFYYPPRAYMMPLVAFMQVWQYGGVTY